MKKTISYLFAVLFVFVIQSCENEQDISASEVPQPVMSAFKAKYPGVTATGWEKIKEDNKTIYEAEFKRNNKFERNAIDVEVQFDENGNFIKEE
jgi:hypothetical protein